MNKCLYAFMVQHIFRYSTQNIKVVVGFLTKSTRHMDRLIRCDNNVCAVRLASTTRWTSCIVSLSRPSSASSTEAIAASRVPVDIDSCLRWLQLAMIRSPCRCSTLSRHTHAKSTSRLRSNLESMSRGDKDKVYGEDRDIVTKKCLQGRFNMTDFYILRVCDN